MIILVIIDKPQNQVYCLFIQFSCDVHFPMAVYILLKCQSVHKFEVIGQSMILWG